MGPAHRGHRIGTSDNPVYIMPRLAAWEKASQTPRVTPQMNRGPRDSSRSVLAAVPRGPTASRWKPRGFWLLLALGWILAAAGLAQAARQLSEPSSPAPGAEGTLITGESGKPTIWGTVRAVHDGKSLTVVPPDVPRIEVRLLGVEPPELPRQGRDGAPLIRGQPFGPEAVKYLRDLVMDKQVRIEVHGKDRAGRTLAVVWLGDISVNLALVKEGFAWVSPHLPVPNVRAELEVAERQARVGKYGLWALPGPEPPWEYRSRHHLPAE